MYVGVESVTILAHDLFMKGVDIFLSFPQTLRSSQMHFYSSSSLQITAHISSFLCISMSATSSSIFSMIHVVSEHNLFIKVEDLSSSFP